MACVGAATTKTRVGRETAYGASGNITFRKGIDESMQARTAPLFIPSQRV
jgi:hypothetical protein